MGSGWHDTSGISTPTSMKTCLGTMDAGGIRHDDGTGNMCHTGVCIVTLCGMMNVSGICIMCHMRNTVSLRTAGGMLTMNGWTNNDRIRTKDDIKTKEDVRTAGGMRIVRDVRTVGRMRTMCSVRTKDAMGTVHDVRTRGRLRTADDVRTMDVMSTVPGVRTTDCMRIVHDVRTMDCALSEDFLWCEDSIRTTANLPNEDDTMTVTIQRLCIL